MKSVIAIIPAIFTLAVLAAGSKAQWDEGMDDDAGKARATSRTDLPAADYEGARKIYPKRDRLYTTSLDGTWAFKLVPGLDTPDELKGWNEPGYDVSSWDDIAVPGNWETQGFKSPQYGNQIDEMSGFYVRNFRWNYRWEGQRVILRFDGVLFGYEVWVNGKYVGRWGSAYNLAQWDITDKLVQGRNTIAVKVLTRSHAWLFDTNDCWAIAGIFRSVELFTVPNDYIEDIVFRTEDVDPAAKTAKVSVKVDVGSFATQPSALNPQPSKIYVSLVDDFGMHALDFVLDAREAQGDGIVENAHLWSPDDPYLYDLVVTLVDKDGNKIERISERQGLKTVRVEGTKLLVNNAPVFLNGVAWNEIDPVEGRAISKENRRAQMQLMKKAGVNAIRTAHYPFGPDFLDLADEMGFYVIDEVPFGSRGSMLLKNRDYLDELLCRTEATMRRDKNHVSVIYWTFGNENSFTPNTVDVLAYAKAKDPTRPRGLPQIGSSQAYETMYHPERDVDINCAHYLNPDRMKEFEEHTTKPIVQTEFAHACGNGFNDFENRYGIMCANKDVWAGGCIWAWIDQSIMHPDNAPEFEKELSLTRTIAPNHQLPKDMRRDLPRNFQGNYLDALHFIDSWGDRATDGIVYGDGTPKDGYWLVKALYAKRLPTPKPAIEAPRINAAFTKEACSALKDCTAQYGEKFMLRVGRKPGMDQIIQTMGKPKAYRHDDYIIKPQVLGFDNNDGAPVYSLRWTIDGDSKKYIEGEVSLRLADDGKIHISYELSPSENCIKAVQFVEVGLTVNLASEAFDRVDWVGDGILTSVPGKSKMNTFGTWCMHKDDYRFPGNRSNVKWVAIGQNGSRHVAVLESQTGNVSFENVSRSIYLTENLGVAGYGGKSSGPSGLSKTAPKDLKMKGEFSVYQATLDSEMSDVVPDLNYTSHYGF